MGREKFDSAELMHRTFAEIDSSDIVVVELSEKGVGVGIEAGYARAKGKPIITVARRGSDVSETLKGISREVFIYQDASELEKFFGTLTGFKIKRRSERIHAMFKEFKEFAMRGNVLDLAIGLIIGGAFGKIITSFVNDLLMPPIGLLLGKVDFSSLYISLSGQVYPSLKAAKRQARRRLTMDCFSTPFSISSSSPSPCFCWCAK